MSHTIKEKNKLLARVGRIRGQVEALERALATETECAKIMHMIAGIRGSVSGLMAEVVVDVSGQEVVSIITKMSAQSLGLKIGDQVTVVIKSSEVMIAK